jgi:hypothetical protein
LRVPKPPRKRKANGVEQHQLEDRPAVTVTLPKISWLERPDIPLSETELRAARGAKNMATATLAPEQDPFIAFAPPSASEQAALVAGEQALIRLRGRRDFDDWLLVGGSIATAQNICQARANSDRPFGGGFNRVMRAFLDAPANAWLQSIHPTTRSDALWVYQRRERIIPWRDSLQEELHLTLNDPGTIRRRFRSIRYEQNPPMHRIGEAKYRRYVAAIRAALASQDAEIIADAGLFALDIHPPSSHANSLHRNGNGRTVEPFHAGHG